MRFVEFDPTKHKHEQLYQSVTVADTDDVYGVHIEPVDVEFDEASQTPWYYLVAVEDMEEGGPGSGHHGHRGIPGYRGGSMAPGAIQFGPGKDTYQLEPHLQAYCEKRGQEFQDKLTGDEGGAVIYYSTDGHYPMNNCLRLGRDCDEGKYYIDDLTSALDKSTVPEDTIVYRQTQASVIKYMMDQGTTKDKGFCSTTHNLTWASQVGSSKKPTVCEIKVPAGTKGGYLQKFSPFEEEAELLLQRGTQFKFTGVIEKMAPGRKTPFKVAQFEVVGQDYA